EGVTPEERDRYWATMQVPYLAYYNYEEILAVFGDAPQQPGSLLAAYEQLAGYLTDGQITRLPLMSEPLRERTRQRFVRRSPVVDAQVVLRHAPVDEVWADWVGHVLQAAGIGVNRTDHSAPTPEPNETAARPLVIVSQANLDEGYAVDRSDS